MVNKLITKLKHLMFYTKVLCVRTDLYKPIKYKWVKTKDLCKMQVYNTWTAEPIYIEDVDAYYMLETRGYWNYKRGSKLLVLNTNTNEIRLATCKSTDTITYSMPDILDGNETPGIGYEYKGVLIENS